MGLAGLFGWITVSSAAAEPAGLPKEMTPVAVADARASGDDLLLIDVRTPGEWLQSGLAQGAARVTLQDPDFLARVEALTGGDRARPVAFICRSGNRSGTARDRLIRAGYTHVTSVSGGMLGREGWTRAGLPLATGADDDCDPPDPVPAC